MAPVGAKAFPCDAGQTYRPGSVASAADGVQSVAEAPRYLGSGPPSRTRLMPSDGYLLRIETSLEGWLGPYAFQAVT
jgi:hypothetical protein